MMRPCRCKRESGRCCRFRFRFLFLSSSLVALERRSAKLLRMHTALRGVHMPSVDIELPEVLT